MSRATLQWPYNGHMPIGPSCAIADVTPNGARVCSDTQDAYRHADAGRAALLGLPQKPGPGAVLRGRELVRQRARHDDAAAGGGVMSQLAGTPVRLQFMRWDEHGWDNYGPAQMMDIRGGVDANGNIVALDYTAFTPQWTADSATDADRSSVGEPADAARRPATGRTGNCAATQYNIPNRA